MKKREFNNGNRRLMKTMREKRSVSLRQLADELDVNYTTISYWENGKRYPGEGNIEKLEKFFNVSIEVLMEEDPKFV